MKTMILSFLFWATSLFSQESQILHLQGSYYEMGLQHGKTLKKGIERNLKRFLPARGVSPEFEQALPSLIEHVPPHLLQEIHGIADGANVAFEDVLFLNLVPELFHCTGFTVKDSWTRDGKLYHVRVLDYGTGNGLQDTAVLFVYKPSGKIPFVNVAYSGFVGCVTGMNAEKIAIGEIGGKGQGSWNGMPMAFLLREIMENASSLEQARSILIQTPRTCEYYYVISDGKIEKGVGVYATANQIQFLEEGSSYSIIASKGLEGADDKYVGKNCEIETSPFQTTIKQNTGENLALFFQPLESCVAVTGPDRFNVLMETICENRGRLDAYSLQKVIKLISLPDNLHNVIFKPSEKRFWVAHSDANGNLASESFYQEFSFDQLIK